MKALTLDAQARTAVVTTVPKPSRLARGEVLVKVHAIGLNPVDSFRLASPVSTTGRVVGSDFYGVVADGNDTGLEAGQRVAGFVQGASTPTPRAGAFAEYVVSPADLLWRVPASVPGEQAAATSLGALTAAMGWFLKLGLKAPFAWDDELEVARPGRTDEGDEEGTLRVLVHGASSSVGLYAAQLARLSAEAGGRRLLLVGTASSRNHALLRAAPYRYDHLVDYHDGDWAARARALAPGGGFDAAFDAISEGTSVRDAVGALDPRAAGDRGGGVAVVLTPRQGGGWADHVRDVPAGVVRYLIAWQGLGNTSDYVEYVLGASPRARAFAVAFYEWLSSGDAAVEANPVRLMPGGLEQVVTDGLALLGPGGMGNRGQGGRSEPWMRPVSAEKLVYVPFADESQGQ